MRSRLERVFFVWKWTARHIDLRFVYFLIWPLNNQNLIDHMIIERPFGEIIASFVMTHGRTDNRITHFMQSLFRQTNSTRSAPKIDYTPYNIMFSGIKYMHLPITWWLITWVHLEFLEMFMNNFLGVPLLNLKPNNYNLIINSIITRTELEIPITDKHDS